MGGLDIEREMVMDNIEIVMRHRNPQVTQAEIEAERKRQAERAKMNAVEKAMSAKSPGARRRG